MPAKSKSAKSTNGKSAKDQPKWGAIETIDAHLIPPDVPSEYWGLFTELALRLERTPERQGLAVVYPEGVPAGAKQSLSLLFARRLGKGTVKVTEGVTREGVPAVFVQRWKNYVAPAEARRRGSKSNDEEAEVTDFD